MNRKILSDILSYLEYLNSSGLWVSAIWHHRRFRCLSSQTSPSTYHLHPVCNYFRFNYAISSPCPKCVASLCQQAPTVPTYRSCFTGVEEWVFPILYQREPLAYIRIFGYRGKLDEAKKQREILQSRLGEESACWYQQLSEQVPSLDQLLPRLQPLQYMFEALYHACAQPEEPIRHGSRELYLQSLNYIQQKYMSALTVETLAGMHKCSAAHLQKVFRQEGNTSVHAVVRQVRLERAEMLLTSTSLAISHIAARCGFPDSNYFCVAFKAKYGLSPSKYRAKHKSTASAAGKNKL